MIRYILALLAAVPGFAAAQEAPSSSSIFRTRLLQAESSFQLGSPGFQGSGAAVLAEAVDKAQYVLVGEAHFSQEIPHLTVALCHQMATKGLRAMAVETGPEAVRILNRDLRRSDRQARLASFMQSHPDAMAFQNNSAESAMSSECASEAGTAFELWGLDQEFFGASGFMLEEMAAAARGPAAKQAIARLSKLDQRAEAEAVSSGSPSKLLIYTIGDAEMNTARAAIARDGGRRALQLFDAMAETRAIFLASSSGVGDPNGRRARLIKRTLSNYLRTVPDDSRVLLKFGDVHVAKGVNSLRQRDLGNFVAEYAEGRGSSSLHVLAMGQEGSLGGYNGFGRQVKVEPYTPRSDGDYPWLADALAVRPKQIASSDWLLIDLRKLRSISTQETPTAWRQLVLRYDLVAIAPKLTPAFLIGADVAARPVSR
ncbi:hypothetical protein [Sphingomonas sp. CROZ-RG-20F-R02-07]|uniref:hypothetical protein n=1 Tax=Sphingomonas sp. CROZ-RG-20F-R02-07 TaxID=2914832 RepID=UPI001F56A37C|nr:hypothetical protein [Sphingomonas sp. CROZ-RG-20F-R02-07]